MSDKENDKIIDIFRKPSVNGDTDRRRFFKGFQYVKITKDENGNYYKEEALREYAKKCFYIISVMRKNAIGVALYKYKVPYDSLLNFFYRFRNTKAYGEIIDIERYIPEDLA